MVKIIYFLAALGSWLLATGLTFTNGLRRGAGHPPQWGMLSSFGLYLLMVAFIVEWTRQ